MKNNRQCDPENITLSSPRLILFCLQPSDAPALHTFMQKEKVMYAWEHGFTENDVAEWIDRQIHRYFTDGIGYWKVTLRADTTTVIGQAGLMKSIIDGSEVVELGYIFDNNYWHNGYAREAAALCIDYAFNTLKINTVYCTIRTSNQASIRLAETLGMVRCGLHTKTYRGKDMPHLIYRLDRKT